MQKIQRYLKTFFICLLCSIFSVSAQKSAENDPKLMSSYAFKALATSKKFKELQSQLPQSRLRPYRSEGNVYQELLETIEDEVEVKGITAVDQNKKVRTPLLETTLDGLFISGALQDKSYFHFDLVNESYKEKYPDFFGYGGLFLLRGYGNWENTELSMFNRMLVATQTIDSEEMSSYSMIQLRLSDYAVFTIVDYSGSDRIESLKEKVRGINFSALMSIVEYLKNMNAEKLKFVDYMQKNWNTDELEGSWGNIADMDYSYSATKDGNEIIFGFTCEPSTTAIEDRDYYPYEIKYKKSSGEVTKEEIEGVTYYYYPKTNGQNMLFAYDNKSFVNLAIESTTPSAWVKSKLKEFFNLPIDCQNQEDFKEEIKVLQKRLEEDSPMMRDLERSMSFNATVEKLKSKKTYEKFAQLMGKLPKTESIEPFTDSTDFKADFDQLIMPIKDQLMKEPIEQNNISTGNFAFDGTNSLPAKVMKAELKLEGKNSSVILNLSIANESFKDYLAYPFQPIAPFLLSQDGFLVDSFLMQKVSIQSVGDLPAATTELRLLGGSNALVVFFAEHASLTLIGLRGDYSKEELEGIVKKLDPEQLTAMAEKYKNIDESYWEVLQVLPKKIFESEQTAISIDQKSINQELKLNQEGLYGFFATYGHPFKLLDGGHYYFMINCQEESSASLKEQWAEKAAESGYEEVSEGKYTIYSYNQEYMGNADTKLHVIVHKDAPNKQIVHTVERVWTKRDLGDHFDAFFEKEVGCGTIKELK